MTVYIVYEARLSNGMVYIGRTGKKLEARIKAHQCDPRSVLHFAFGLLDIEWRVLWEGQSYAQSMSMEIAKISGAKKRGEKLLNRTRGGWYDKYDCGVATPSAKARGEARNKGNRRRRRRRKKDIGGWLTPPSVSR